MQDPKATHKITAKDRTFERGRGCYNCINYENGELSRQHWAICRPRDELHVMQQHGIFDPNGPPKGDVRFQMIEDMDLGVRTGMVGLCMRGKAKTDFVHHAFLCDGWTGRDGASVATAGRPIDPLPEELHEIADSRAKKAEE